MYVHCVLALIPCHNVLHNNVQIRLADDPHIREMIEKGSTYGDLFKYLHTERSSIAVGLYSGEVFDEVTEELQDEETDTHAFVLISDF